MSSAFDSDVLPAVGLVGLLLPLMVIGAEPGLVPLPARFLRALAAIVAVHFVAVELVKRWFYRRMYRATN